MKKVDLLPLVDWRRWLFAAVLCAVVGHLGCHSGDPDDNEMVVGWTVRPESNR